MKDALPVAAATFDFLKHHSEHGAKDGRTTQTLGDGSKVKITGANNRAVQPLSGRTIWSTLNTAPAATTPAPTTPATVVPHTHSKAHKKDDDDDMNFVGLLIAVLALQVVLIALVVYTRASGRATMTGSSGAGQLPLNRGGAAGGVPQGAVRFENSEASSNQGSAATGGNNV